MMPHSFWTFDLGNLLTIICIGGPVLYGVVKLYTVINDYIPHKHTEESGPLHTEGIVYPRSMVERKR